MRSYAIDSSQKCEAAHSLYSKGKTRQMALKKENRWIESAVKLDNLEVDVCFQLPDNFFTGDPQNSDQLNDEKYYQKIEQPNFERLVKKQATTREIMSNEAELAAYYKSLLEKSSASGKSLNENAQFFWLRLWLWNFDHDIYYTFPWYDTYAEIQNFFAWVKNRSQSRPYQDVDQGWRFDAVRNKDRIVMRETSPDTEEQYANASIPRETLLQSIASVEDRTQAIITLLSKELDADYWTKRH